jgi:hypothetical protein
MRLKIVSLRFLRNGFFKVLLLAAFTIYVKPGERRRLEGVFVKRQFLRRLTLTPYNLTARRRRMLEDMRTKKRRLNPARG